MAKMSFDTSNLIILTGDKKNGKGKWSMIAVENQSKWNAELIDSAKKAGVREIEVGKKEEK